MTADQVVQLAKAAGIEIDPAYLAEVARNLEVLLGQAALLYEQRIAALVEPAPVFRA